MRLSDVETYRCPSCYAIVAIGMPGLLMSEDERLDKTAAHLLVCPEQQERTSDHSGENQAG